MTGIDCSLFFQCGWVCLCACTCLQVYLCECVSPCLNLCVSLCVCVDGFGHVSIGLCVCRGAARNFGLHEKICFSIFWGACGPNVSPLYGAPVCVCILACMCCGIMIGWTTKQGVGQCFTTGQSRRKCVQTKKPVYSTTKTSISGSKQIIFKQNRGFIKLLLIWILPTIYARSKFLGIDLRLSQVRSPLLGVCVHSFVLSLSHT